jgi:hypothetical protein
VDTRRAGVVVQLARPAVVAPLPAPVPLGDEVRVRLVGVDPATRSVELAAVDR